MAETNYSFNKLLAKLPECPDRDGDNIYNDDGEPRPLFLPKTFTHYVKISGTKNSKITLRILIRVDSNKGNLYSFTFFQIKHYEKKTHIETVKKNRKRRDNLYARLKSKNKERLYDALEAHILTHS